MPNYCLLDSPPRFDFPADAFQRGRSPLSQKLWVQSRDDPSEILTRSQSLGLAIVGTREASPALLHWLKTEIAQLRGSGLIIVSGLARGVDQAAHEAALEAGLQTIAFVAGGLDRSYPADAGPLRKKILESGGMIASEQPPGELAKNWQFLERNRLIAGYSLGTLVAQAGDPSGAINTAVWAERFERKLWVVPALPFDSRFAGNRKLLDEREGVIPYWSPASLGQAWLKLVALASRRDVKSEVLSDSKLQQWWTAASQGRQALEVREILDQALAQGGTAQDCFSRLEDSIRRGELVEQMGLILKNPRAKT